MFYLLKKEALPCPCDCLSVSLSSFKMAYLSFIRVWACWETIPWKPESPSSFICILIFWSAFLHQIMVSSTLPKITLGHLRSTSSLPHFPNCTKNYCCSIWEEGVVRIGYIIYEAQCKTKMHDPLFKKKKRQRQRKKDRQREREVPLTALK